MAWYLVVVNVDSNQAPVVVVVVACSMVCLFCLALLNYLVGSMYLAANIAKNVTCSRQRTAGNMEEF